MRKKEKIYEYLEELITTKSLKDETNKCLYDSLTFIDAFRVKKIINKNIYENRKYDSFRVLENIDYFIHRFPLIFNKSYIADLFIATKRRLFYYMKETEYSEELLMEIMKKEKQLRKYKRDYERYKDGCLDFYSILPNDFFIKKDKNKKKLLKYFPEYFYLIDGPYDVNFYKKVMAANIYFTPEMFDRIDFFKNDSQTEFFVLKTFCEKQDSPIFFNLFKSYLIRNKSNFALLNKVVENLSMTYLPIKLEKFEIDNNRKEFYDISKKCPNLYFQDEDLYKNLEQLKIALDDLFLTYVDYSEKNNEINWKINENELSEICEQIDFYVSKQNIDLNKLKEIDVNCIKKLIMMNTCFYEFFYFKGKYSKEFISFIKNIPTNRYNDVYFYKETFSSIMEKSLDSDIFEKKLKTNIINFIMKSDIFYEFIREIQKYLNSSNINKKSKIEIIKSNPILMMYANSKNIFDMEDLEYLISENNEIFKYLDTNTTLNNPHLIKIAIRTNEENIRFVPEKLLKDEIFVEELLMENKRILKLLLKILDTFKNYNYNYLEKRIMNEYKKTLNPEYLYYLSNETLEGLIITNEINLNSIENKKVKKKLRKIYSLLSPEDFF